MRTTPFSVSAVLFDFDGTLSRPGTLDFNIIKKAIHCPPEKAVLEFLDGIDDPRKKAAAIEMLDRFEAEGAARSTPNTGAEQLIDDIHSWGIPTGIITRNSKKSIVTALLNFPNLSLSDFKVVITRDDPIAPKPSEDGVIFAAARLGCEVEEILVIGDFIFDIESGNQAGAITVLLDNGTDLPEFSGLEPDFRVSALIDIGPVIKRGLPLAPGKLPNEFLSEYLDEFNFNDPSVLISAGVGDDTAAIDIRAEEVMVLKSDPITFATDAIAEYAVLVNANDIATAGAAPRWFLTTLMFPVGTTASHIHQTMKGLYQICHRWGITLCGGHTEITDAVTRPVVVGMMAGTVASSALVDKRNMTSGDRIILTKKVAVEGTAIIAREFHSRLSNEGMAPEVIAECKKFLSHISILPEAKIAMDNGGVTAMHDVTEGGLATAVSELAVAGQHHLHIDMDKIPIFEETSEICKLLDIDPMGLIGSGSLLICCMEPEADRLLARLQKAGIDAVTIGKVLEKGAGVTAKDKNRSIGWPNFETDEITRLF
ncbi:MAG: HAD hydrolase-like protein [Desulfobacteraceae bacterium]|nr:HAD hydrolase-like protein [Desulfobacteraceae bacterium]